VDRQPLAEKADLHAAGEGWSWDEAQHVLTVDHRHGKAVRVLDRS
jgi:hypothetical protein